MGVAPPLEGECLTIRDQMSRVSVLHCFLFEHCTNDAQGDLLHVRAHR